MNQGEAAALFASGKEDNEVHSEEVGIGSAE